MILNVPIIKLQGQKYLYKNCITILYFNLIFIFRKKKKCLNIFINSVTLRVYIE